MNLKEATRSAQQFLDGTNRKERALPYGMETETLFLLKRRPQNDDNTVLTIDKGTGAATLEIVLPGEDPWPQAVPVGNDPTVLIL